MMFRFLILLVSFINFLRDYLVGADTEIAFKYIFSLFVLELVSDALTKPLISRVLNRKIESSHHYSKIVIARVSILVVVVAGVVAFFLAMFFSAYLDPAILALLPVVVLTRYCIPVFHLAGSQSYLYFFELAKSLTLLLAFSYEAWWLIILAYSLWSLPLLKKSWMTSSNVSSNPAYALKRLLANFRADYFASIQTGIMCLVYILDKVFAFGGSDTLFYLLITKIMFTTVAMTNQLFLIPLNIKATNSDRGVEIMRAYILPYFAFAVLCGLSAYFFFGYVVPRSPLAVTIQDSALLWIGVAWYVSFVLREIFIRAMMMMNKFSFMGKFMLLSSIITFLLSMGIYIIGLKAYLSLVLMLNIILIILFAVQVRGMWCKS